MRSGNGPLAFKLMGSSPVKQEYQADAGTLDADNLSPEVEVSGKKNIADIFKKVDRTEKPITPRSTQVVNENQEVSSSNQVKKPGIDTQLVEYVRRKIDERKNKNKIEKEEENQAKPNSSNNSTEKGSEVEEAKVKEVKSTDIEEKTDTEVDTGEKKKGWKFDIDWNEVGTNAVGAVVTTGIKAGVEALGGNKKPIRKGGSMSGFASQKFSSGSNLFAKKSDDM